MKMKIRLTKKQRAKEIASVKRTSKERAKNKMRKLSRKINRGKRC